MKIGDSVEDFVLPDEHGVPRSLTGLLRRGGSSGRFSWFGS